MKSYTKAGPDVLEVVKDMLDKYHADLTGVSLKLDVLMVATDEEGESALKLHGYPCAAAVRILGAKDRTAGRGDAEIVIDEEKWRKLKVGQQRALIDHELTHLQVAKNRLGRPKLDHLRRPKLKLKLHDRQFGWFDQIATRHKQNSMEVMQATQLVLSGKQIYFSFALALPAGSGAEASVELFPG